MENMRHSRIAEKVFIIVLNYQNTASILYYLYKNRLV